MALLDSESSHSFLHPKVVNHLKLPIAKTRHLKVKLADGRQMISESVCNNLKFQLQGHELIANLRLLDIQRYDVILGVSWMKKVGPVTMDFEKGTYEIKHKGRKIDLVLGG